MSKERTVFFGVPSHNGQVHGDIVSTVLDAAQSERIGFMHQSFSLLARNFNELLCEAINRNYDYFLLLHSDIVIPQRQWLTKMLEIMDEKKCDVLSVVSPKKGKGGLTSTAVLKEKVPFRARCLSMKDDIAALPKTFEVVFGGDLLVNTGVMLIDLKAPWVGSVWFEINDEVIKENGNFKAMSVSEDWNFSMRARAAGAKIFATREIQILHIGQKAYSNQPEDWK